MHAPLLVHCPPAGRHGCCEAAAHKQDHNKQPRLTLILQGLLMRLLQTLRGMGTLDCSLVT